MAEVSDMGENLRFVVTSLVKHPNHRSSMKRPTVAEDRWRSLSRSTKSLSKVKPYIVPWSFLANSLRLMLDHSAAYVILHRFRQKALAGTSFANAQFEVP